MYVSLIVLCCVSFGDLSFVFCESSANFPYQERIFSLHSLLGGHVIMLAPGLIKLGPMCMIIHTRIISFLFLTNSFRVLDF